MKKGILIACSISCLVLLGFVIYGCGTTTSSSVTIPRIVFLRGSEWAELDVYSAKVDGSDVKRLTYNSLGVATTNWPKLSPDGAKVLYSLQNGATGLYVIDINGTASQEISSIAGSVYASWSPDSSKVAFLDGSDLHVWDGVTDDLVTSDAYSDCSTSFSPDGNLILYRNSANDLHVYVSSLDAVANVTNNPDSTYSWPVFSPVDNNIIAYKTCMGIYSLDISTGTVTTLETGATHRHICFGPNGEWVYYTLSNDFPWRINRVKYNDASSKETLTSLSSSFPSSSGIELLADGNKILISTWHQRLSPMFFPGSSRLFYVIDNTADFEGNDSELYSLDPENPSTSKVRLTTNSVIDCFDPNYWD